MTNHILHDAEEYARTLGWRLIPLYATGERAKRPRISEWPKRATNDVSRLRNWYYAFSELEGGCAFGLACGAESGVFVVDVDDPELWEKWLDEHGGEMPETVQARTGGGGTHYFFKVPDNGIAISTGTNVPCQGVDIRADGGQVVLPPAPHPSGNQYQWIQHPLEVEIADAPEWLLKAVTRAADKQEWNELHDIWEHRQNDHLHHYGRALIYAGWSEDDIISFFISKWKNDGLPNMDTEEPWDEASIRIPVESGIAAAKKKTSTSQDTSDTPIPDAKPRPQFGTPFGMSDADNALRLEYYFGDDIAWTPGIGWLTWDGKRWREDRQSVRARGYAEQTTRKIHIEAGGLTMSDANKLRNHAKQSRNLGKISNLLTMAQGLSDIYVEPDSFDIGNSVYLINFLNGTLDLTTGELREPKQEDLVTKLIECNYNPVAECPVWLETLDYAFGSDPELIAFIQRALGLSLTGEVPEHLFICWGAKGRNGKSTILENFYEIIGKDYAGSFSPDAIMLASNDNFTLSTLAQMRGLRFATTSESGEDDALKVGLIKMITGGDTITVKHMRMDSFSYRPAFKVWIRTNHKPAVRETTDPIWRRLILVPFVHQIPVAKMRPREEIDMAIKEEAEGVLAWAVAGARAYLESGLQPPEAVTGATREYRRENDPIGIFIKECCLLGEEHVVHRSEFRRALGDWLEENVGWRKAPSTQKISKYLQTFNVEVKRDAGGIYEYRGVALADDSSIDTSGYHSMIK